MQPCTICSLHRPGLSPSIPQRSPQITHRLPREGTPIRPYRGHSQSRHLCRAEGPRPVEDEEPTPQEEVAERLSEVTSKKLAPGQATAIITGGVSIVIGIGYLVLAYFLDQRGGGGMMQPPPPEAFN